MADVVLVQPKVGDWDEVRSHFSLPLGLLSASRLVAKEYATVLIDTRIDKYWKRKLKEELMKHPLCVGVTSMTGRQIGYALEIANYVKEMSKVPVVWGGMHGSLLPESTLENDNIDILVIGEGEITFFEAVKALFDKTGLEGISGVWHKEKGQIVKNKIRSFSDLNSLPELPLLLIDTEDYLPIFKGRRTFYIETSRGCVNQCAFCYNAIYNNAKWRAFSAERVIRELKDLSARFNIGSFYIVDDNFFVDLRRALAIAKGIIDEKLNIFWEAQGITINSAIRMDDEYLKILVKSGLKKVHFGVESGSEDILRSVNKNIKISDVIAINKKWSRYDIIVQYNFMCGFPGETMDDIRKTKDLIFRLMKENTHALISPLCPYTPYPGTPLYQKAIDNGFICKKKLHEWQEADYGDNIWESREKKKFLSSLYFASMFLDRHRLKDMINSIIIKALIEIYRPVARFRVKYLFFKFMPEIKIKELVFKSYTKQHKQKRVIL